MAPSIQVRVKVSAFDGSPLVVITWCSNTGQWSPEEARMFALRLMAAAEVAEQEAALARYLRGQKDFDDAKIARIIDGVRGYRR